jgi:hypothetical protein
MLRPVHARICVIALLGVVVASGNATPGDAAAPGVNEAQAAAPAAVESKKEAKRKKQPRRERPLPNFSGRTLEGERLEVSSMLGKRLVIFFFNPEVKAEGAAIPNPTDVALSNSEIRRAFDRLSGGGSTWTPH